jgi:hypothetical protein
MARTLDPDISTVGFGNTARDGQAQARSAALEFGLSRGMQQDFTTLEELLEHQVEVFRGDADAGIPDLDFNFQAG